MAPNTPTTTSVSTEKEESPSSAAAASSFTTRNKFSSQDNLVTAKKLRPKDRNYIASRVSHSSALSLLSSFIFIHKLLSKVSSEDHYNKGNASILKAVDSTEKCRLQNVHEFVDLWSNIAGGKRRSDGPVATTEFGRGQTSAPRAEDRDRGNGLSYVNSPRDYGFTEILVLGREAGLALFRRGTLAHHLQ